MITSVTASIAAATSVASSAAVRALSSCLEKLELWNILSLSTHLRIRRPSEHILQAGDPPALHGEGGTLWQSLGS